MKRKDIYDLEYINLKTETDDILNECTVTVTYKGEKMHEYTCSNCSRCVAIHLLKWLSEEIGG